MAGPLLWLLAALPVFCLLLMASSRAALATLPRDLHLIYKFLKFVLCLKMWVKRKTTLVELFVKTAARTPHKVAVRMADRSLTFRQVDEESNRLCRYLVESGREGTVAVLMATRPDYLVAWLGVVKAGRIAALVNTNLRGKALVHSLNVSSSTSLIYGKEMAPAVEEVRGEVGDVELLSWDAEGSLGGSVDLTEALASLPPDPLPKDATAYQDKALYVFTSGTTGLPKAAIITHSRLLAIAAGPTVLLNVRASDVLYDPLPLYHTAGGLLGLGTMMFSGCTVVLRPKFSASNFWPDCIKYDCTVAQYIGETCRYMLATPESALDRAHKVRLMFGNGLRPKVWGRFKQRFRVPFIAEFYGSTEGNANLVNMWNKEGSCGYLPSVFAWIHPIRLIKVNEETGEPLRDSQGLCIPCALEEPGLLVGKIDARTEVLRFSGYADQEATKKKILTDVFKKGDQAFNSGDILVKDKYGYLYFMDRTGETFRWRGENVSTEEVESVVAEVEGVAEATVFGVKVGEEEGRAGMTAVSTPPNTSLDLARLAASITSALPSYARPLFLRTMKALPKTGTFKIQKSKLSSDGFDPAKCGGDPLYFFDSGSLRFVPLDDELYSRIVKGKVRF